MPRLHAAEVRGRVAAEELSSIPALEDCDELLLAA